MSDPVRHVDDAERRARIAQRHALTPSTRVETPEAATRAMTVLHSTEPATVYLSCWARVSGFEIADLDRALYAERTLVKQLAMRRTLFVFPRELLPAAWGSASPRVAGFEGARIAKDAVAAGLDDDGEAWLARARGEVLALLAAHEGDVRPDGDPAAGGLTAAEIRAGVAMLDLRIPESAGATATTLGAGRVLTHLGLTADVVRGANTAHWRASRPRWRLAEHWLGQVEAPLGVEAGYAELVRRWLATFGPGTLTDIAWWLGATKTAVRAALADVQAVEVSLDGDPEPGWLLPDDVEPVTCDEAWVALLPTLDPTVMGWKRRDFYLGTHGPALFDRNGNAGTTMWVDGRVVGCWVQGPDGVVVLEPLERLSRTVERRLQAEAARLTGWLGGTSVGTVYPSVAMRHARERLQEATHG